jgi:hypothetical protein
MLEGMGTGWLLGTALLLLGGVGGFGVVVVSNLTIHNIPGTDGRRQALHGAVRVLRGGGRLRIIDQGGDRYAEVLADAGCVDITVRRLDWRTWYGIPCHHLQLITATKPSH